MAAHLNTGQSELLRGYDSTLVQFRGLTDWNYPHAAQRMRIIKAEKKWRKRVKRHSLNTACKYNNNGTNGPQWTQYRTVAVRTS